MKWFYAKDGQQVGPVEFSDLQNLHASGQITDDTLVWQQGTANWIKFSQALNPAAAAAVIPGTGAAEATPVSLSPVPPKANSLAIASLVMGILSLLCCGVILGPAAAICGHIALSQIAKNPAQGGRGLALAGLITGYVGLVVSLIVIIAMAGGGLALPERHH